VDKTREPWASRFDACCWLGAEARAAGRPLDPAVVIAANRSARAAAGPDACATRTQRRQEIAKDTEHELRQLRAVLRKLRALEADAGGEWKPLRDLERGSAAINDAFAAARPAPTPKSGRGQRATAREAAAFNRYVAAFFARAVGRPGNPSDLALAEIAIGLAPKCADADDFRERCKRWSKVTARRPK